MTSVTLKVVLDFVTRSGHEDRPCSLAPPVWQAAANPPPGACPGHRPTSPPLPDLDTVTNPPLDPASGPALQGPLPASPYRREIRDGRYAALRAVARPVAAAAARFWSHPAQRSFAQARIGRASSRPTRQW